MSEVIKSYKGFDKDLKCRGFQYEVGKEYEEKSAKACRKGFHACTMPLEVFKYYSPNESRYCEVEQSGQISKGDDTKVASSKIKIGAEIGIAGLVKAQIEWVKETSGYEAAIKKAENSPDEHATGDQGAASATGRWGAASATGYQGAASATGESSVAMASGYCGKVKGAVGCALFAVERGEWNGNVYPILSVAAGIVDGEIIKADTWYTAKNGAFVEV